MKILKNATIVILCVALLLAGIFLSGRYGWKLFGFSACEAAGIEQVSVEENQVRLRGYDPGLAPEGFLGYHARQEGDTLYIGFRFSGLFGFFETGDFDITVPTEGTVTKIILKTADHEFPLWPEEA